MEYDIQTLTMDTNYLDIEEYLLDPIEWEVEKALRILRIGDEMEE